MPKYVGQSVKRKEDYRLLTGSGQFVADMKFPEMAEAAILRSTYAHALIKDIHVEEAKKLEGVYAVITAKDIEEEIQPFTEFVEFTIPPQLADKIQPVIKKNREHVLATDRVTYMGQAIVVVVAENRYVAEDAIHLITVDYEALPVVTDPFESIKEGATLVHPDLDNNIQARFHLSVGEIDQALGSAEHIIQARIKTPRVSGNPLETRGVVAVHDSRLDQLQIWSSTQVPFMVRSYLSKLLGIVENEIRVIAPDVGGGFGPKCAVYPEEIIIPYLAIKLKRPVKWIEDRYEHLQSTRHSRDQVHDVEVGFNSDGTIVGLKDRFLLDNGAFNAFALCCAYNSAAHLRGIYKIPNYDILGQVVLTNKTPNVPYRGAGRPEAVFVMDRVISMIASKLGLDPVDVILKNIIQPEEIPYPLNMCYRDGNEMVYDSGNYPEGLMHALEISGYEEFRKTQEEMKKQGRHVGIGISSYIEGTGIGPHEGAIIRLDSTGHVMAYVGSSPHGQSHETTLAQICADEFGISPDQVSVKAGDTGLLPYGAGTYASRGAVTAGSAVQIASQKLREKLLAIAGEMLEVSASDLDIKDGVIFPKAFPQKTLTFREIALAAKPGPRCKVPKHMEPGAEATHYFVPPTVTFSSGFHVALIEVDKETGFIDILRYIVVHDCGKVLNPMVVDGQIQGGVAQGIGGALYEEIVYNENGQLLSGTYMDYLLPTSIEVPEVEMGHQEHLSTRNPMGIKGVGEGGAISPPAAIANAVVDALRPLEIEIFDLPMSPSKIRSLIEEAESAWLTPWI